MEARVLACLLEKEITTPEYYPMSVNALVNACNQKSNRDPVVSYDDDAVEEVLEALRAKGLAVRTTGAGSRVPKHSHRLGERLNLGRREMAILCELMLRGPQTVGELRNRADRMHPFDDLQEVELVLERLAAREEGALALKLSKRRGEKECRYTHLLRGAPALDPHSGEEKAEASHSRVDRLAALEEEVARLRQDFDEFRKKFE